MAGPKKTDQRLRCMEAGTVLIPKGSFTMGASNGTAAPQRTETSQAFCIHAQPVTVAAYNKIADKFKTFQLPPRLTSILKSTLVAPDPQAEQGIISLPIAATAQTSLSHQQERVSFFQAYAYCSLAGMRLAHEVEWEKAARGPQVSEKEIAGIKLGSHKPRYYHSARLYQQCLSPDNDFGICGTQSNFREWVQPAPSGYAHTENDQTAQVVRGGNPSTREFANAASHLPGRGFRCTTTPETLGPLITRKAMRASYAGRITKAELTKFEQYQATIEQRLPTLRSRGVPIRFIGQHRVPVVPYDKVSDTFTPKEYIKFLSAIVDTPEDVRQLITPPFMRYIAERQSDFLIREAHVTMAEGGADCDNRAWAAKRFFEAMGKRHGVDYQPRVIAADSHAVCLFRGKDGKHYVIDQGAEIIEANNLAEASSLFTKREQPRELFAHAGYSIRTSIDPANFRPTRARVSVSVFDVKLSEKAKTLLPRKWKQFDTALIHFPDNSTIMYTRGTLAQKHYPDGTVELFKRGQLVQKDFADGKVEIYENGVLYQRNLADGTEEMYRPNGTLLSKHYPTPHRIIDEFFYANGKIVKQRNYRSENTSSHAVEWFNEQGNLVQTEDWNGSVLRVR